MDFSRILVQALMTALCSKLLTTGYEVLIKQRQSILEAFSKRQRCKLLMSTSPPVILDSEAWVDSTAHYSVILLPYVALHPIQTMQLHGLDTLIMTQQTPQNVPIFLDSLNGQPIQKAFTLTNLTDNRSDVEIVLKLSLNRADER
ncbi:MAG: hypothetical protein ACFE0J_22365 [Elainellaceae cyanobacterium]